MTFVLDASVAAKWLITEADSHAALAAQAERLCAPSILRPECANAVIRRVRVGELTPDQARELLGFIGDFPIEYFPFDEPAAIELGLELRHPIWDCGYLALALTERVRLITADEKFCRRAAECGYGAHILLLSDYA